MTQAGAPIGFTSEFATIRGLRLHYVRGGSGPVVMLLHGYPQNWYEWRAIAPGLAEHFTVVAIDLRGAGQSQAPAQGYDKTTLAADAHGMLEHLGLAEDVRLVGHDIGTMVAYAYAAQHPRSVFRLVLGEAPLPMADFMYGSPALTAQGPGLWNFGFFSVTNGLPESVISGKETHWIRNFVDLIAHHPESISSQDIEVYAQALRDPARLRASFEYFRAFPADIADVERYRQHGPLPMPVLALGGQYLLGELVGEHARRVASDVTSAVIADSGHWIAEEQPSDVLNRLLAFLK
ncbi:alpha/beta fold hydrolase [Saccharopolyspora sp. NPDC000995]